MFTISCVKRNSFHSFAGLYSNWLMSNCTVCQCASMVKHPFFRGQRFGISCLSFYQVLMTHVSWWWLVKKPPDQLQSGSERISPTILVEATWKVIGQAVAQWWQKHQRLQWSISLRRRAVQCTVCSALTNPHIWNSRLYNTNTPLQWSISPMKTTRIFIGQCEIPNTRLNKNQIGVKDLKTTV